MGDSVKSLTQLFDEIRSKSKDLKFQSHSPHCPPLVNIYNTCFVNVVLQALFHTVPLTSFLLEQNHGSASSNTNFDYFKELQAHLHEENVMVLLHFIDMIQTFCSSSGVNSVNGVNSGNGVNGNGHSTRTPVKPLAFIRELRTSLPSYEWGKQHDAQELLIWLLNCFHDCLSKLVIHKIEGEPTCKLDQMRVDATIQWVKNYFKPPKSEKGNIESNYAINAKESTDGNEGNDTKFLSHYSQILRIFGGQSLERINCENCNFINYKYESFLSSELTIPENSRNIQDLLSHQCALERLDCENEWTCDQCHTKNQPYRRMTYWQLPEILVLSMKRFSVERIGHNFYPRKIDKLIEYDPEGYLNLDPFVSNSLSETNYKLYAIICHTGNLDHGHYYAFCRFSDSINGAGNQWLYYNDEIVRVVDSPSDLITADAYILFYRRALRVR